MREIKAECTGTIVRLDRRQGDRVDAGEPIVTIESMKMEIGITFGAAVRLMTLRVRAGQAVNEGDVVAIVELVDAPSPS